MAKDLTPVPSTLAGTRPKGDGCLLRDVDMLREEQSTGGEELSRSVSIEGFIYE